ncbi:MAG: ZIP family metal transporter [Patescibacteria group bacterium]
MEFFSSLIAVVVVSLLSLLGAVFLVLKRESWEAAITYTLAISSGILLGTVFFDLIPEAYGQIGQTSYVFVIAGLISFFALEKCIHWHHETNHKRKEKPVAYLALVGDSVHNFLDGAIIAVAFLTSIPLGLTTTVAVIAHEIPHELGDFSILVYGGFSNRRALWYNFLSALTAIAGTIVVFLFSRSILLVEPYLLAFGAGNFLYIAASDLIPELHQGHNPVTSIIETALIIAGTMIMGFVISVLGG